MNEFNIYDFLTSKGFLAIDERTLQMDNPSVKIKLIHPDSIYACGYNTMAVSSPKRLFPKKEIEIPRNIAEANLIINPFLSKRIRFDPSMRNAAEQEGTLVRKVYTPKGIALHIKIHGELEPSEFRVKRAAAEMVDNVLEGQMVYFIYKIESKEFETGIRNYLNIISIHPIHEG